jgi:hypothetical protein
VAHASCFIFVYLRALFCVTVNAFYLSLILWLHVSENLCFLKQHILSQKTTPVVLDSNVDDMVEAK